MVCGKFAAEDLGRAIEPADKVVTVLGRCARQGDGVGDEVLLVGDRTAIPAIEGVADGEEVQRWRPY